LTELRRLKEDGVKQFWNLRRFLKKSQLSTELRIRIEKYLEHAWLAQKSAVSNDNLPILKLLTDQLRDELNFSRIMPHLKVHPLFAYMSTNFSATMQRIATKALSQKAFAPKEPIFHRDEIAQHLGFVVAGRLQYVRTFPDQPDQPDRPEYVDRDEDWITEPALWTPAWVTLGELRAVSVSELVEVSSVEFAEAIKRTPQVYDTVCGYATNFVNWINSKPSRHQSDICQGDIVGEAIENMLGDDVDSVSSWANPRSSRASTRGRASLIGQKWMPSCRRPSLGPR